MDSISVSAKDIYITHLVADVIIFKPYIPFSYAFIWMLKFSVVDGSSLIFD